MSGGCGWVGHGGMRMYTIHRGYPVAPPVIKRPEAAARTQLRLERESSFSNPQKEPSPRDATPQRLAAAGTRDNAAPPLRRLEGGDGRADNDGQAVKAERAEHLLGVRVDLETASGRGVEGRDLGNVLVLFTRQT